MLPISLCLVEQRDELVLDARRRGAGDLLPADAGDEAAEGVDLFGQAGGTEDGAGVGGDDGGEARLDAG